MFTFSSLSFLCFSSSRVFIIAMRLTMFMLFFLLFLVYVFLSSGDKVFFGAPLTGRTPRGKHELDLSFSVVSWTNRGRRRRRGRKLTKPALRRERRQRRDGRRKIDPLIDGICGVAEAFSVNLYLYHYSPRQKNPARASPASISTPRIPVNKQ